MSMKPFGDECACGDGRLAVVYVALLSGFCFLYLIALFPQHCCAQIDLSFVEPRKKYDNRRISVSMSRRLSAPLFIRAMH